MCRLERVKGIRRCWAWHSQACHPSWGCEAFAPFQRIGQRGKGGLEIRLIQKEGPWRD